jgi:putative PEP-CTERM system TPR-repeat lipoprotein
MTDRAQALSSLTEESKFEQCPGEPGLLSRGVKKEFARGLCRRRGWPCLRRALAALCAFPLMVAAQQVSPCKGPAELEKVITSNPSPGAFDALGAYFASHHQFSCAISAFESAVHLAPDSWDGHYDLGIALLSDGDAHRATRELQIASKLKPGTEKILLPLGMSLSAINQQDAAIDVFRAILKQDPQSVAALDGLTKALIAQGRYAAAISQLTNAPANEVLRLNLAVAYSKNGNTDEALQTLSAIVKEHPSYAKAHMDLGIVYTQQKRFGEAAKEFEEVLRLNPGDDEARLSYVKALTAIVQFERAAPIIRDYLKHHPHDFEALYFDGITERGLANYADAEKVLRQAVAQNPNHAEARYHLGFVLTRQGKLAEARVQLEKALELDPHSGEARFQLASVLRDLGQQDQARAELKVFQEKKAEDVRQDVAGVTANQANQNLQSGDAQKAVTLYREAIANDPGNAHTYYDLALALDRLGDYAGEREALEKAVTLDAKLAPVHNQLGFLDLQANQAANAENQFKTAISLDPQYAEAQNNLGVLYGQLGKAGEAEQLFRKATENNPQYAQAFANLGLILASESRYAEAAEALRTAVQLDPKNPGALSAYGMVLVRLNRGSDALPFFRKVTELDPKSPGAHLNLGIALADQFDLNGALAEFSEAVRLDPGNALAHYNKGRVLLDLQHNREAKPELEAATRLDPSAADSWYLLGMISRQAGDTDESIRQFEQALAAKPDNAEALFLLGQELLRKGDEAGAIERWRKAIEIRPQYNEAIFSLARLLMKSDPEEAKRLQARFQELQAQQHIMDRAQTLGNFALASADAHDWPQAIAHLREALDACGTCNALPQLHKDLGLIYCHSGDFTKGRIELLEAQKLSPADQDVAKALALLAPVNKSQ